MAALYSDGMPSTVMEMSGFEKLYRHHFDAVFRFAWRLAGRRDIAEEITAETFLELYQHLDAIDVGQLPSWLFTVARHRAMDYWRRRTVEERYMNTLSADPAVTEAAFDGLGLFNHPSLKSVHRLCLRLRYGYGMSLAEIANATGLSETQAKGHLQYARSLLRKEMRKESR